MSSVLDAQVPDNDENQMLREKLIESEQIR